MQGKEIHYKKLTNTTKTIFKFHRSRKHRQEEKKKVLEIPASAMKIKGNQKSFSLDNIQVYLMEEYSAIAELSARKEKVNAMWARTTF